MRPSLIGTRIRERRIANGLRQNDLAKLVGISPAYLNLIEHNRRRIAGKLLLDIAQALHVEPAILSEGAEAAVIAALQQAIADHPDIAIEADRLEEFAGRFPGWAALVERQAAEINNLRLAVEALSDRLSHDPFLSTALHEVISTVSAIQSSASILVESKDIEKEWRDRFQRNIFEDSRRLAETSKSLVGYLDPAQEHAQGNSSPLEDVEKFLAARAFNAVEPNDKAGIQAAPELQSDAARQMAEKVLTKLSEIVRKAPEPVVLAALSQTDDPSVMAEMCGLTIPEMFQRLAYRDAQPENRFGYLSVDASGALLAKRSIDGFGIPRAGGGCPLWPLYSAFSQPGRPIQGVVRQAGRDSETMQAYAIALPADPPRFGQEPRLVSHMILRSARTDKQIAKTVGVSCRICTVADCAARRETSILSEGF